MKRILVPCDFSASAHEAYKFAIDIASTSGGEVFVLKVVELSFFNEVPNYYAGGYQFDWSQFLLELQDEANENFQEMRQKYQEPACPVSFNIARGSLSYEIYEFITEKAIDLVVMGTQGATGLKEFFVGSNTEKIVRTSSVPVIAVRKAPYVTAIRRIVVPTDLDLNQGEWMDRLKVLQNFFKAILHILWVNTQTDASTIAVKEQEQLKKMEGYVRHYKLKDYSFNIRNNLLEQDGILSFTDEIGADMIAMATRGRKGLSFLVSGSIAQKIVNRVDCPIWTSVIEKEKKTRKRILSKKTEKA